LVGVFLSLGDLETAEAYASKLLQAAQADRTKSGMAATYWLIGRISLCQSAGEEAVGAFESALQLSREIGDRWIEPWTVYALGRAHQAQGDRAEALKWFQEAIALLGAEVFPAYPLAPPAVLNGLEEAHEEPEAFRVFCRRLREEYPQVSEFPLARWFLEPAEPRQGLRLLVPDLGLDKDDAENLESGTPHADWVWQDPFGDCSFTVQNGLEVHAANGRDLRHVNLSAPRLLRSAAGAGDLAVQTVCVPALEEKPASGGILLWKDRENYLRLDRGTWGEREITFLGCLKGQDVLIGRGCLPLDASGQVCLRLERLGGHVNALCSADGKTWFTVGHVAFPVEGPVQVGLHAIGSIDRTIYRGAYPDGTAIRFNSFALWGM
jgi:hypothetical protein